MSKKTETEKEVEGVITEKFKNELKELHKNASDMSFEEFFDQLMNHILMPFGIATNEYLANTESISPLVKGVLNILAEIARNQGEITLDS